MHDGQRCSDGDMPQPGLIGDIIPVAMALETGG